MLSDALARDLRAAGAFEVEVAQDERRRTVKIMSVGLPLCRVLRTLAWEALLATHAAGRVLYCGQKGQRVIVLAKLEGPRHVGSGSISTRPVFNGRGRAP